MARGPSPCRTGSRHSAANFPPKHAPARASWRRGRPCRGSARGAMPPGRPLEAPGRPVRACVRRHRLLALFCQLPCHIDRAHRWCVRAPATGRDGSAMVRGCPGVVRGCGGGGSRPRSGRCTRELTAVPRPSRRLVRRRTRCTPGRAAHARTRRCSSSRCSSCGRRRLPRPRRGRTTPSPTAASAWCEAKS